MTGRDSPLISYDSGRRNQFFKEEKTQFDDDLTLKKLCMKNIIENPYLNYNNLNYTNWISRSNFLFYV